jgi:hypothetical protein
MQKVFMSRFPFHTSRTAAGRFCLGVDDGGGRERVSIPFSKRARFHGVLFPTGVFMKKNLPNLLIFQ